MWNGHNVALHHYRWPTSAYLLPLTSDQHVRRPPPTPVSLLQGSDDTDYNICTTDHYLQVLWHLLVLCHYVGGPLISCFCSCLTWRSSLFWEIRLSLQVLAICSLCITISCQAVTRGVAHLYRSILWEDWTLEKFICLTITHPIICLYSLSHLGDYCLWNDQCISKVVCQMQVEKQIHFRLNLCVFNNTFQWQVPILSKKS